MYLRDQLIHRAADINPAFHDAFDAVFLDDGMEAGLVFALGA